MRDRPDLEDELVALGRALVTDPPRDDLADLVLARLAAPAGASHRRVRRPFGRRLGWAVAAAVALVLGLLPPVRAAVVELLHIGGVVVREEPRPSTPLPSSPLPSTPSPGTAAGTATGASVPLAEAERLVGADIAVPSALGAPTSLVVTHEGRVAELTWDTPSGPTRLDVFVGSLSWGYVKTVWDAVTATQVSGHEAVWFGAPHLIEWVDRSGVTRSEPARLAGPTLVWVVPSASGEVTYRLEGPASLPAALAVAGSAR